MQKFCLSLLKKRCAERQLVMKISIRNVTYGKHSKMIVNIVVVVLLKQGVGYTRLTDFPVQDVDSTCLTDFPVQDVDSTCLTDFPVQGLDLTCLTDFPVQDVDSTCLTDFAVQDVDSICLTDDMSFIK